MNGMRDTLIAIVRALDDVQRNRYGKLEPTHAQYNALRDLLMSAPRSIVPNGGRDIIDQVVMVAKAALGDK